jgi:hypothetical protein
MKNALGLEARAEALLKQIGDQRTPRAINRDLVSRSSGLGNDSAFTDPAKGDRREANEAVA